MTVVYWDRVVVLNGIVDYLLLLSAAWLSGLPLRRGRLVLWAALGGLYAGAVFLPGLEVLGAPVIRAAAGIVMALGGMKWRWRPAGVFLLLAAGLGLWRSGLLSLRDRCPSPAGDAVIRIYDGAPGSLSAGKALSLQLWEKRDWRPSVRVEYPGGEYQGLWWAPDGEKYLLAFRQGGEPRLDLCLREQSVCRDLTACLAGFPAEGTEYQFLQWSEDGGALLLHYREAAGQSGYFWYDIASGEVSGVWEMGENG